MSRRRDGIDYTGLIYHVLRRAHTPLALDCVVSGVQQLASVHAANPKALIRHILEQSTLIEQSVDGRYGYLPQLLEGNAFRQPLPACPAEQGLVELSTEVLAALWPGRVEAQRQRESRRAELILPGGAQAAVHPLFRSPAHWGLAAGPELYSWLAANHRPGDDLIIRVVDGDAGRYAAELARRERRSHTAMAACNRHLADQAARAVAAAGGEVHLHRLATMLIVEGAYRDAVPPDPLNAVLARDDRFVDAGPGLVALSGVWREKASAWPVGAPHPLLQQGGLR